MPNVPIRLPAALRRGDLAILFLIALALRVMMFAASYAQVGTDGVFDKCFDCKMYYIMGQAIASGDQTRAEFGFFNYGPGYGYFMALNVWLVGARPVMIIIINIIFSSLSCLLIYSLAMRLIRSYAVAMVAGGLLALSYTSILLSCCTLSDTFFFFLFLSALLVYLRALDSGSWVMFVLAGLLTGASVLTRSVGQFWFLMMIVLAAPFAWRRDDRSLTHRFRRRELAIKVGAAVLIIFVMMGAWMARNYRVHGVATLAITSANGPANLVAITMERLTGKGSNEVLGQWVQEYQKATGKTEISLGELFRLYAGKARAGIDSLGGKVYATYFSVVWENLNEINYFHRILIPQQDGFTIPIERKIKATGENYLSFILSLGGLVILLWRRQLRTAIALGGIYLYFASMIGFFRWAGSRYFFPGQIAAVILIAVVLVWAGSSIAKLVRRLLTHRMPIRPIEPPADNL